MITKEVEVDVPQAEHNNTKPVKMIPDMPMAKKRVVMGEVDDMTCSSQEQGVPKTYNNVVWSYNTPPP